jgi:hypothetical protein
LTAPVLHEKDARMHQEEIRLNGHEKPTAENPTMLTGKLKVKVNQLKLNFSLSPQT